MMGMNTRTVFFECMGAGGFAVELVFGVVSRVVCLYGVDQHMAVYEY